MATKPTKPVEMAAQDAVVEVEDDAGNDIGPANRLVILREMARDKVAGAEEKVKKAEDDVEDAQHALDVAREELERIEGELDGLD